MDVRESAGRLPPERLLVAIETQGEEIKKGRVGKKMFFHGNLHNPGHAFHICGRKCSNYAEGTFCM